MIEMTVAQFVRMLENFSSILDKAQAYAEAKKFDAANLLNARLAPDQFHFIRQVQILCDTAKAFPAKMSGKEPPKHEDNETTIVALKDRVQRTVQYLQSFKPGDFKGWESQKVTNPRREGKYMVGSEWAIQHAIPNFYFHFTTAYAILRHNGLDIGKRDYLGEVNWRDL